MRIAISDTFALHAAICCGSMALSALPARAEPGVEEVLTPASYFECQIAAQEATVVGLRERAAQLNRTDMTPQQRQNAGAVARERVSLAMYACHKQSGSTLGAYAHRHADELKAWLAANPQVQARLQAVGQRIKGLSEQMPATKR